MQELKIIDIEILKYIYKNEPIHKSNILKKFPEKKYYTEYRLKTMTDRSESGFHYICEEHDFDAIANKSTPLRTFYLSDEGKKHLLDIERAKNLKKLESGFNLLKEAMRSVLCPIFVAFVTAYLTMVFLK